MANKQVTTSNVFKALHGRKEKIIVMEGSSRSTKTYSIIQHLISLALENEQRKHPQELRIAILRARLTWLKNTVYQDFKTIMMQQFGLWDEGSMNKTEFYYTLGSTVFVFSGLDHDSGQKFHGAKYSYAWLNEAIELDYPSVRQILLRLTGQMFIDYNPNMDSRHWIETKIKTRKDVCVMHSTYLDNPFLEEKVVNEIESLKPTPENIENGTADETSWNIYGLGLRAELKGLIYPSWTIISEMPKEKEYEYGLDWGFSNDPCALIRVLIKDGTIYCQELLYERGLTNIENISNPSQISLERRLGELNVNPKDVIGADSAEPKSIQDIKNCGYNIRGVTKGPDSIMNGIAAVKRFKIAVVESSTNLITELSRYKWSQNKSGDSVNSPVKSWDHLMDAIRYCVSIHDAQTELSGYAYDSAVPRTNLVNY